MLGIINAGYGESVLGMLDNYPEGIDGVLIGRGHRPILMYW